jgi:glycosyltransferase involved in cell wall biosynthesis
MPTWLLHVVGSGPERDALQALSDSLALRDRVMFHGFVSDEQLAALYERSHVFLMPALQGYGLPALEALYRHSAVVMNVESGAAEILGNTPWVSIAAPGEPAFHAAVRNMLTQVATPGFFEQPLPALPSMQTWARDLITQLAW